MSYQIGDYITPTWTGHAYYGQTGKILTISNTGGASIDWNGDGIADSPGVNLSATNTQSANDFNFQRGEAIVRDAEDIFDVAVPVVISVVGLFILLGFIKQIKKK
tara:strand:+ start:1850 stop:2164 length:315 start_codon:yes stop_codon:yes gene_type:complete